MRVLVISASMGAGHDGAARELARRLRSAGHHVDLRDFLDSGPLRIGRALRSGYEFEIKHVPSAYDATYRLWYRVPWLCPAVAWLVTFLTGGRVRRWVRLAGADVVVSTYPLATLCLGRLRERGHLRVPAVNFITDFGVHPLWVHRGVDLNLAVHHGSAEMAGRRTGRPAVACGPVVAEVFGPSGARAPGARAAARAQLGLAEAERAVLVVAGSWGIGGVEATWRAVAGTGHFTLVVVCGRDERLRRKVTELASGSPGRSIVLGWTDRMPSLMAACDVLVENAGGLTSLEAMRAGLPVVSFRPIAGHGRENTAAMAAAGVSRLAADAAGLVASLEAVTTPGPDRESLVEAAGAMFTGDGAALVVAAGQDPVVVPLRPRRRPVVLVGRTAAAMAGLALLAWTGLTSGVEVAAATGAGVAHPAPNAPAVAYVGVRLDGRQLLDPAVGRELRQLDATAVVDQDTAMAAPGSVQHLAASGVNVESGGRGRWSSQGDASGSPMPWTRAHADALASQRLGQLIGVPVTIFVPGRRVNAWDLVECSDVHTSVVVPNQVLPADAPVPGTAPIPLTPRSIYLVNGLGATPAQLVAVLGRVWAGLGPAHVTIAPLAALQ